MTNAADVDTTQIQRAMPISRVLRLLAGLFLVFVTVQIVRREDSAWILRMIGIAVAFVPFYALLHALVGAYLPA